MTLALPNLDDRTFDDLVDEARALIRTHQPEWTNQNPSDPGITLIELFAWLAEMLIYRCDQVPDRHRIVFLRLLNGPGWTPPAGASIDDEVAAAVTALRARFRAVTAADYEALAFEASPLVARAVCLARRDLGAGSEAGRTKSRPGYVSVVVLAAQHTTDSAAAAVRARVRDHLEPRRLLTTQNVVAEPVWAPVGADILIAPQHDVPATRAVDAAADALEAFLDPWRGGPDGRGWPFGRDVLVSEVYSALEALPEVDYVPYLELSSTCAPGARRCAEAAPLWNRHGDQIGLGLAPHVLPRASIDRTRIRVSTVFVAFDVAVTITVPDGADGAAVTQAAMAVLRKRFSAFEPPGPAGGAAWSVTSNVLAAALASALPGGATVASVVLGGDASRVTTDELGVTTARLGERELPDMQAQVIIGT